MKRSIPSKLFNSSIKGKPSTLMNNPCFVKSIAVAYDVEEKYARTFCKEHLGFSPQSGTDTSLVLELFDQDSINNTNYIEVWRKWFPNHTQTLCYLADITIKTNTTTVGNFVSDKSFSTGTYILVVNGHAFVYKNGVIIGNKDDGTKLKRRLMFAIEIKQI
jgi:hypothetical protein